MRVELHCHSTASDGCLAPEKVAELLAARGVRVAALTDHNTLAGQQRFRAALEARGVQWLSGVEIHIESPLGPLHLLAYDCDVDDHALSRVLRVLSYPVWGPMRHWMERAWARRPRNSLTHPFNEPAAVAHGGLDASDGLRIIHEAGGKAFLAHPLSTAPNTERLEAQIELLRPLGLDGLEAFYKSYSPETCQSLCDLALRHDLLVSAGSDFHGPTFPDGGPGYDMPDEQWQRFASAFGLKIGERP